MDSFIVVHHWLARITFWQLPTAFVDYRGQRSVLFWVTTLSSLQQRLRRLWEQWQRSLDTETLTRTHTIMTLHCCALGKRFPSPRRSLQSVCRKRTQTLQERWPQSLDGVAHQKVVRCPESCSKSMFPFWPWNSAGIWSTEHRGSRITWWV